MLERDGDAKKRHPALSWEPAALRQRLYDWAGYGVAQPGDNLAALDHGRKIVDRQHEARLVEHLLDRRFLLPLGGAVVAGHARLHVADLAEGFDDLIVEVINHVTADRSVSFGGLDDD